MSIKHRLHMSLQESRKQKDVPIIACCHCHAAIQPLHQRNYYATIATPHCSPTCCKHSQAQSVRGMCVHNDGWWKWPPKAYICTHMHAFVAVVGGGCTTLAHTWCQMWNWIVSVLCMWVCVILHCERLSCLPHFFLATFSLSGCKHLLYCGAQKQQQQ